MKKKDKKNFRNSRREFISIIMYVAALIAGISAIVLLINNIILFNKTVSEYVTQGYPNDTVTSHLIPTQLIPGVFEPIAVYGGIAFMLLGIGKLNKKFLNYLEITSKRKAYSDDNAEINGEEAGNLSNLQSAKSSI